MTSDVESGVAAVRIEREEGEGMETQSIANEPTAKAKYQVRAELNKEGVEKIGKGLRLLLADVFTLYFKTKNFHWHISGPHFRDHHRLLDEQADQLFGMTDPIAERARKLGVVALRSIGEISRKQRLNDNDEEKLTAVEMLRELCADNRTLTALMREAHELCDLYGDVSTASLLENWIDDSEGRSWFLAEILLAD
jgi:starvation-inducible DNA-binding protein